MAAKHYEFTTTGYAILQYGTSWGIFSMMRNKTELLEGGFVSEAAAEHRFRERFQCDARPRTTTVPRVCVVVMD